ncbi:hypothetical protein C4K18_4145 [Pseudomonas chlororaphis subsp. aurantiaca]|nr:hypothetical protein C4K18_4145 [Pseudomonas chlororaphis subsp. aurantiaca]
MALGHQRQLRQLQDFLHLEHVDREQLSPGQTEHEDFQAILTHQLRALIYRVENAGHVMTPGLVLMNSLTRVIGAIRRILTRIQNAMQRH